LKGTFSIYWLKIGGVSVLVFLAAYALVVLEARQKNRGRPSRPTTYSAASGGYKALYVWLRDLGLPIKRWEKPFVDLPPEASVLLVVEPELGPGTGELVALEGWVRKGGTLVLAVRPPNVFLKHFDLEGGLSDTGEEQGEKSQTVMFQPGPYTQGVRSISSKGHPNLKSARSEVIVHARDAFGGPLAVVRKDRGRVMVLADPILFCNKSLREGDNSRLALNLLITHQGEGTVLVDEFHHGYGRPASAFGHFVRSRALGPLLQLGLVVLVLWAATGRRFGPPRPLMKEEGRSSMEYVSAMAQIFQRAQARAFAMESFLRWIEEEAKRLLVDRDRAFQKTLKRVGQRLQGPEMTDRELLVKVRDLYGALAGAKRKAPGGEG
jgi:hypothetical protein